MAFIGRLHPLLVHFPIALVIAAVVAEGAAAAGRDRRWHQVAVTNIRAGALFSLLSAFAGWRLAFGLGMDAMPLLEWHRWVGTAAAGLAVAAAVATHEADGRSPAASTVFRLVLFGAGALVGVAGHLGGLLVWGAEFLRP
jgi:uncharacterized membrane protein